MAAATKNYRYQDYTVAWICALPLELAAAEAMLDEIHPSLPAKPSDDNAYILGKIFAHNVVIACLPSGVYGTTSATAVATQMRSTFKSIRFFLMVGIGGGAPGKNEDIRLGDVVVSKPTRDLGGVVQYDYGKAMSNGRFQRTGVLNKPPTILLTAISALQAAHMLRPNKISSLISDAVMRNPIIAQTFAHPGEDQDLLFDHEYDHPDSEDTCINCDQKRVVKRLSRARSDPLIHYGLIASGNQVVKDSRIRDELVQELGIICFEMEAAGLMGNFPCLNYAAATAAAYAKELLSVLHANQVVDTPPADLSVSSYIGDAPYRMKSTTSVILRENVDEDLIERISNYDHKKIHRKLSQKRLIGTTQWFLNHPDFQAWFTEKKVSSLWCSGKIGSGKTMIATSVVEAAKSRFPEPQSPTVYFYCDYGHYGKIDASYIVCSFIRQICEFLYQTSGHYPDEVVQDLRKFFGPRRTRPDFDDLQEIFTRLFHAAPDTIYIVDGIDALREDHAKRLLTFIQRLFCSSDLLKGSRILLLSRDQVPGYINIDTFMRGIRRISTSRNVMQDIETYIETSIADKMMYRKLTSDDSLLEEIKLILLTDSSDMFLWVYLQLEILWDTCRTDADIHLALDTLPRDIEEIYSRCVGRIDFKDNWALKVLKWVSFANKPLHIEELKEAVAFDSIDTEWDASKKPQSDFIIGCCANLVVMDPTDNCVRFAHSSVKQYLEEDRKKSIGERLVPGYPAEETGDLECGEYCITYLSFSDFSLQLSNRLIEKTTIAVPPPFSIAHSVSSTSTGLSKFFSRHLQTQKRPVSVSFRTMRAPAPPNRTQYVFLDYAIANWASHTKQMPRTSPRWEQFERLATCFNETWNFHPWVPGGRSHDSYLHGLFGWAVREQHKPLLSIVQDMGPSLQRICNLPLVGEGLPALHIASKLGHEEIVKVLVTFCDVNYVDQDACTPLHYAAGKGHLDISLLLLLQKGIRVDVNSRLQCTPLWQATNNGHEATVSLLVDKGASLEAKDATLRQTPLSRAVENEHLEIVRFLLGKGARTESRDADGQTPLGLAIEKRNKLIIEALLLKSAKLDSKYLGGWSLLLWATENGIATIVKAFIEKDASYFNKDLVALADSKAHKAVVVALLSKRGLYDSGELLSWAVNDNHLIVVKVLFEMGADPNTLDPTYNQTVLYWAVKARNEPLAKFLLQKGANPNCKDAYGATPLHHAAWFGSEALVGLLLDNGADPNSEDENLATPLQSAIGEGVTRRLLEKGADPNKKTRYGTSPIDNALKAGDGAVAKVLQDFIDAMLIDHSGASPGYS
ncbi:ankyrin repeat-containing [Trichoderma arundinaceum]|uniref:Ankyrin repeat-containing n=1 Tax=Trichoderma arundinaceum TaxID=490622 RepID=A0A395N9F1_TRIAR|nr:ankyrin repeat-containing [Trichoderma arundinaceum]